MTNTLVTVDDIAEILGRELKDLEIIRAQLDIDRLYTSLEGWCRRKFSEQTINDERHIMSVTGQTLDGILKWAPVKEFLGIKYQKVTNPLQPQFADYWDTVPFYRGSVVYASYTTDISDLVDYFPIIKQIIVEVVIGMILRPDVVKFGVLSSYSVEGMSISYDSSGGGRASKYTSMQNFGDIQSVDLQPLAPIRRRIIK